ncbi:MAG: AarF/ABC1/UbiB kinase family protein [Dehalobacter sp. 4CP]|nr:AarF/ABC1/UbiB kinase family protein [Dehalobacter sp. 4CP]
MLPTQQNPSDHESKRKARFREILGLLVKHNLASGITPEKLVRLLEDLGPTYIKLGQIMSMRNDILPKVYCAELAKLRSEVAPMSFEDVQAIIEDSCGSPLPELFKDFEETPLGSASIAQAHRAHLMNGTPVVVKVQRRNIFDTMSRDITMLKRISRVFKYVGGIGDMLDLDVILDELWHVAQEEMDFLHEAGNAEEFYQHNTNVLYISCPRIIKGLTTSKVLVMEHIEGCAINDYTALKADDYDFHEIGEKLADNYVKQVIDDGFFHADPHPGNIRIQDGKIVWIDFGMMGRLSMSDQRALSAAVKAIARRDVGTLKDVVISMGVCHARINHAKLYADIDDLLSRLGTIDMGSMDIAMIIDTVLEVAQTHKIAMPPGMSMLGRGMATLQGVLAELSPDVNFIEIMAKHMRSDMFGRFDWEKAISESGQSIMDSGKKALDIPALLADSLRMAMKGQTKLGMELQAADDFRIMISNWVNTLVKAILVASLLLGSSLLSTTDMQPQLFQVPAIGVIGYSVTFVMSVWLLVDIRRSRKK